MKIFLKPAVPKCWLFVASGGLWSLVGLTMCASGVGWLKQEGFARGVGFSLAGVLLAVFAVRWKFGDMAKKNIRRLRRLPERGCFFAFQAWQSYAVILVMIFLGITLRHSPVPKTVLAVVYTAIGGALVMGSYHYHRHLIRLMRTAVRRRSDRRSLPKKNRFN